METSRHANASFLNPERAESMKSLLTTALIVAVLTTGGIAQTAKRAAPAVTPTAELTKAEREFFYALVHHDTAKLDLILSIDFKEVDTNGRIVDRKEFLAQVTSSDFAFDNINVSDFSARFYGQTAVTSGISTYAVSGKTVPERRYTSVWVKRLGRWQLVSLQSAVLRMKGKLVTTESGLQYQDIVVGTGVTPTPGQNVSVHYTGTLENGTKFDSSIDRGEAFQFKIGAGRVIKGWDEGVMSMKVGGKRRLVIPSTLGYGSRAMGPIPANSTLIFDVELLAVE
jgi:hypothetical protein